MASEHYTESLTLREMKCAIGKNDFGYVFPQGDVASIKKVEALLKKAGGKPQQRALGDFLLNAGGAKGKAKPEYIITFNDDINTIIVVECKRQVNRHESPGRDKPAGYAVDGVLYYAKFLKAEYNVIAIAISGAKKEALKVSTFHWLRGQDSFNELQRVKNIILEPTNYMEVIRGERLKKSYSLDEIRSVAIDMHEYLREIKMPERYKPIFIAGVLIALEDDDFIKSYKNAPSYDFLIMTIERAIEKILMASVIKSKRIDYIRRVFVELKDNSKFKNIPLGHHKSITWYVEQLELKIKPMMGYADSTIDALGVFYHEFIKYSGGDGKGLGIVLTPQHLTEFMCELADVGKNSRVADICCGTGSFLITAMTKMFEKATPGDIEKIRAERLYGVEFDSELYSLSIANMIIRKDGKSNIYYGDCFDDDITQALREKRVNVGLINPPYAQNDKCELEFLEQLLNILVVGGVAVCVAPMSCAIGTKFKEVRERLFEHHTLKAVFSMPEDIFYPVGTVTCVMVWQAHKAHNSNEETFFGYYKDDGFAKRKKLGRIDHNNKWQAIKNEWLSLYRNRDIKPGLSVRARVRHSDEWCAEAYMETDYGNLTEADFINTVKNYVVYQFLNETAIEEIGKKPASAKKMRLGAREWAFFSLGDLFTTMRGKRLVKEHREFGATPLVTAGQFNLGVKQRIDSDALGQEIYENKITVDMFCNSYYHSGGFSCDDNILALTSRQGIGKYAMLFVVTVINQDRYRYQYGRQYRQKSFLAHKIKLPVTKSGAPDWRFMEEYVKALPYSGNL